MRRGLRSASDPTRRAVLVCGIVAGVLAAESVAHAAFPGRNGRLAVSSAFDCEEGRHIVTMRPDGSGRRALDRHDLHGRVSSVGGVARSVLGRRADSFPERERHHGGGERRFGPDTVPLAPTPPVLRDKSTFSPHGRHFAYTREQLSSDDRETSSSGPRSTAAAIGRFAAGRRHGGRRTGAGSRTWPR